MAGYDNLTLARPRPAVASCWMYGICLPVTQMAADGDSACDSVRSPTRLPRPAAAGNYPYHS